MPASSIDNKSDADDGRRAIGPVGYIVSLKEGIPSFTRREIRGLKELGCEIHLYATKKGRGLYSPDLPCVAPSIANLVRGNLFFLFVHPIAFFRAIGIAVKSRTTKEFVLGAAFARIIRKRRTRVVHSAFGDRKMFVAFYASMLADIPLTTMIHSHELTMYIDAPAFELALNRCSEIMTVCEYNRVVLSKKLPHLKDKIHIVRLFVDLEQFKRDERTKVLTVAKFHEYKGYDVLAKTAGILKDANIVFWIVGEGPVDVPEMIRRESAVGNTVFLGAVGEDVLKMLYQCCDVFCLPSRTASTGQKEGLPVSLMEAMSFAKPVVSTRHAGIPELVPSKIVEENNPQQLAQALMEYASNPAMRVADGERNKEIVRSQYSPGNLNAIMEIFRRVSNPHPPEKRI